MHTASIGDGQTACLHCMTLCPPQRTFPTDAELTYTAYKDGISRGCDHSATFPDAINIGLICARCKQLLPSSPLARPIVHAQAAAPYVPINSFATHDECIGISAQIIAICERFRHRQFYSGIVAEKMASPTEIK